MHTRFRAALFGSLIISVGCNDAGAPGDAASSDGSVADVQNIPSDGSPLANDASDANEGGAAPDVSTVADGSLNDSLPSGDHGIAARYPADRGIAMDPEVIFADDFESYANAQGLNANWDNAFGNIRIATEPANVYGGTHALEFRSPQQMTELSNGVQKIVRNELDMLFLRYYAKYDPSFDVVGSSHNGGGISAHYFQGNMATPGVPADGRNKFLIEYECWRGAMAEPNPGNLNVYIYHPEQRSMYGDHFFSDGTVLPNSSMPGNFGPSFVARPNVVPELGRWYSFEVMLRANTVGMRDGRVALWLDGMLIADFRNLRLRDVDTLKIDRFNLSLHIGSNTVRETRKYYDNVVAARSYIGPVFNR